MSEPYFADAFLLTPDDKAAQAFTVDDANYELHSIRLDMFTDAGLPSVRPALGILTLHDDDGSGNIGAVKATFGNGSNGGGFGDVWTFLPPRPRSAGHEHTY